MLKIGKKSLYETMDIEIHGVVYSSISHFTHEVMEATSKLNEDALIKNDLTAAYGMLELYFPGIPKKVVKELDARDVNEINSQITIAIMTPQKVNEKKKKL